MSKKQLVFIVLSSLLSTTCHYAQEHTDLSQKANDPTASLMAVQLIDEYTSDYYHSLEGEDANAISFRAAYPYTWGETNHIARVTLPYTTKSPSGDSSIEDMTLFDMAVFPASWGRFGLGVVTSIPLADGHEQWSAGPALGFVNNTFTKGLNIGIFNQNLFRFTGNDDRADTKISSFQPIVNYSMGEGWNIGTGDIQYIYDWESSQWVSLPLAIQIGKLVKFGKLPVILSAQYQHNFADDVSLGNGFLAPTSKTTFTFTAKFLFPKF